MLINIYRCIVLLLAGMPFAYADITQTVIHIFGEIQGPTCTIKNKDIVVEFGTLTNKDLWFHGRSPSQDIVIEFENCTAASNTVFVSFRGEESFYPDLQGSLALDGDTQASPKGIAISLSYLNGDPLPINQESTYLTIGNTQPIRLKTFVQASQQAINTQHIELGEFSATAHFLVEYQ